MHIKVAAKNIVFCKTGLNQSEVITQQCCAINADKVQ